MPTIITLAEALAKVSCLTIDRLDIQYNTRTELYSARLLLTDFKNGERMTIKTFDISEDGTITIARLCEITAPDE